MAQQSLLGKFTCTQLVVKQTWKIIQLNQKIFSSELEVKIPWPVHEYGQCDPFHNLCLKFTQHVEHTELFLNILPVRKKY